VVVTDQVMPGMRGEALFRRMKEISPALRFILCTGFSDGASEAAALALGIDAFFLKPVSPEQVATAIRRLFDGDALRAGATRSLTEGMGSHTAGPPSAYRDAAAPARSRR